MACWQGPEAGGARYTLVGVVEHSGQQLASGHYWAYVQRGLRTLPLAASWLEPEDAAQGPGGLRDALSSCSHLPAGGAPAVQPDLPPNGWDDITASVLASPTDSSPSPEPGRPGAQPAGASEATPSADSAQGDRSTPDALCDANGISEQHAEPAAEQLAPQWYYASDAQVNKVSRERVLACEAYILLYMRVA